MSEYRRFLEIMDKYVPRFSKNFENVEVYEIEVGNAPAFADFFGLNGGGFCKTVNFPCDYGIENMITDAVIEALTGWRTGYFKYVCKKEDGIQNLRVMFVG